MTLPSRVRIFEVGARDGLQNEKQMVPVDIKVELIERLIDAGVGAIETGSFVSPKWVPQMADTADVMAKLPVRDDVIYSVLTPNMKGYEGAMAAKADEVEIFTAASELFNKRNINCSIAESIERFTPVMAAAKEAGIPVRASVSCALGSPFGDEITPATVADVAAKMYDMGCYEVSLADTIGVGTPRRTKEVIEAVATAIPLDVIGVHFHDTYGQALANYLAALEMGVARFDSSVAGLGGCPYAPGATGNVATEDVVYMLDGMGIDSSIDLKKLVRTAWFISDFFGRAPVSSVARALKNKLD
ncbi:MAG: hydroxymethylglutaryl-CoA lyase [Sneathiella sp.]|jgi:isopropylmalate/homocitrate/citramalate synthase|uniref:hydroxymethylglutaryl-CoA lyase n=1 Tax=Sneathiella sp. TaxID=1964365 RepID=UPI000C61C657|nr:hydroxymethylglutaryl-CoA lyase [Sneathiella sp.]MAL79831.1 hydroxymethylglutaryl-CoA lyase [Sneathiella sp.]